MAKVKFHEKGLCDTLAESIEALIEQYIIPNNPLIFDYKDWREEHLWITEVDDLYRENIPKLKVIFDSLKRDGRVFIRREEIVKLFNKSKKSRRNVLMGKSPGEIVFSAFHVFAKEKSLDYNHI